MKVLRNSIVRSCVMLAMMLSTVFSSRADIDKKYFDTAAKKVWALNLPQFNPDVDLSDSIFRNQPAVYIARYVGLDADYDTNPDASKLRTLGLATSNAVSALHLRRNMVKLNDASAVEKFTEFTIDAPNKLEVKGYTVAWTKCAFGARIIKPDGSVTYVDMDDAHTVSTGKKGDKDSEYRIVIPGLMPGDILDYFYYDEYFIDEASLNGVEVDFLKRYPTRRLIIDIRASEDLAVEYGAYNGAPQLSMFDAIGGKNSFFVEYENVESLDEEIPDFSRDRQLPFLRFYVINNKARLEFVPKNARPGGMRLANSNYLLSDIAAYIAHVDTDNKCVDEAVSITRKWAKAQATTPTDRQIADVAYLALRYVITRKDASDLDVRFAKEYYKVLEKLHVDIPFGIAVTSSRQKVPVDQMIRFVEPDYVVMVGDSCYFSNMNLTLLPGEMLPGYDTESYWKFKSHPDSDKPRTENGNLRASNAMANTVVLESDVAINTDGDDDNTLIVSMQVSVSGASNKRLLAALVPEEMAMASVERFLMVNPSARDRNNSPKSSAAELRKEMAERLVRQLWSDKDATMTSYSVDSYGVRPDSAEIKVTFKGSVPDGVIHAGDNHIVNLGRFISEQVEKKGHERQREVSVLRDTPDRFVTTIRFHIPEGYEVVPESLEDLNRSLNFKEASFNSSVKLEGGTVVVQVNERYPRSIYPAQAWESLLAVSDAAFGFNSASIVLRPK